MFSRQDSLRLTSLYTNDLDNIFDNMVSKLFLSFILERKGFIYSFYISHRKYEVDSAVKVVRVYRPNYATHI